MALCMSEIELELERTRDGNGGFAFPSDVNFLCLENSVFAARPWLRVRENQPFTISLDTPYETKANVRGGWRNTFLQFKPCGGWKTYVNTALEPNKVETRFPREHFPMVKHSLDLSRCRLYAEPSDGNDFDAPTLKVHAWVLDVGCRHKILQREVLVRRPALTSCVNSGNVVKNCVFGNN